MKTTFTLLCLIILASAVLKAQNYQDDRKVQAQQLMSSGRYGEAIEILNKFIAANPHNIDAFLLRGSCFEFRGDYEQAVYDYRTARKISPNDSNVLAKLSRATELWNKMLYNKIEGYKREIAIHPDRAKNYLEIGIAYKNLGEWQEAEIWYDEYLKRAEPSPDEVLRYTEILAKNNQLAKGEKILKKFSENEVDDHRLWSRYGYFLLWLGKHKLAISSFEKSLEFRPYFKEAQDGLDQAKGKGYIYTVNDTTSHGNYGIRKSQQVYLIDKLFSTLKKNPSDDESRILLIKELVKVNRFEEAYSQLNILSERNSGSEDFLTLYNDVMNQRKNYYLSKIEEYILRISNNSADKEVWLSLAKIYSLLDNNVESLNTYKKYLEIFPDDNKTRFEYAEMLSWNNDLCAALEESKKILKQEPNNISYQLFAAKIHLWLNEDLDTAEIYFKEVIKKEPNNKEALLGLFNLYLQKNDIVSVDKMIGKLKVNKEVTTEELTKLLEQQKSLSNLLEEKELYSYLETARTFSIEKKFEQSIYNYEKYFTNGGTNSNVYLELADAYQGAGDHNKAIEVLNKLVEIENADYNVLKKRAKLLFWNKNYLAALKEFRQLSRSHPEDAEIKLMTGDALFELKQFEEARLVYSELLSISPDSHILKMRLNWLGSSGIDKFSLAAFPTHVIINPVTNYFSDNTDFKFNLYGIGAEIGLTSNISVGISAQRGYLKSNTEQEKFNNVKGTLFLKFNDILSMSGSAGQTFFENDIKEDIFEISIMGNKKKIYSFNIFYSAMDAAQILYSPFLVDLRLRADYFGALGEYTFKNKYLVSGKYALVKVSDDNTGNQLQFRLGKEFDPIIKAGYEYYYYNFSDTTFIYWSPQNFETHSIWTDLNLFKDSETDFSVGGKLGIVPESDFIIREFYLSIQHYLMRSLSISGKFSTGSSIRTGTGYNSHSFQIGIFWNL